MKRQALKQTKSEGSDSQGLAATDSDPTELPQISLDDVVLLEAIEGVTEVAKQLLVDFYKGARPDERALLGPIGSPSSEAALMIVNNLCNHVDPEDLTLKMVLRKLPTQPTPGPTHLHHHSPNKTASSIAESPQVASAVSASPVTKPRGLQSNSSSFSTPQKDKPSAPSLFMRSTKKEEPKSPTEGTQIGVVNCLPHDDQEAEEVDEADDSWLQVDVIHPTSDSQKLPNGVMFQSIARIRGTINKYVLRLCTAYWFDLFKPMTLTALDKRLRQYSADIEGKFHVSVQIGYKQLVDRVTALRGHHKMIKCWLKTMDDEYLAKILEEFKPLSPYIAYKEMKMAPDLSMLKIYACLHVSCLEKSSLHGALMDLDAKELEAVIETASHIGTVDEVRAKLNKEDAGEEKQDIVEVKKETVEVDDAVDGEDADASGAIAPRVTSAKGRGPPGWAKNSRCQSGKKSTSSKAALPLLADRIVLPGTVLSHMSTMLTDNLKHYFFRIDCNAPDIDSVVKEMSGINCLWGSKFQPLCKDSPDAEHFTDLLDALACIFQSCLLDESARPPSSVVRRARKIVMVAAGNSPTKGGGAAGKLGAELAQAMLSYPGTKAAMDKAKALSMAVATDSACTTSLNAAMSKFEDELAVSFERMEEWLTSGNQGRHQTIASVMQFVAVVEPMQVQVMNAIVSWSLATLQDSMGDLEVAIFNMGVFADMANYLYVYSFAEALCPVFDAAAGIRAATVVVEDSTPQQAEPIEHLQSSGIAPHQCLVSTSNVSWGCFLQCAKGAELHLADHAKKAESVAESACKCLEQLRKRVSEDIMIKFVPADNPVHIKESLVKNLTNSERMLAYIKKVSELGISLHNGDGDADRDRKETCKTWLVELSSLIQEFRDAPLQFDCPDRIPFARDESSRLNDQFEKFAQSVGKTTYDDYAVNFLRRGVIAINAQVIAVHSVHRKVIDETEKASDVFLKIIEGPAPDELIPEDRLPFKFDSDDMTVVSKMPFWIAFAHLCEFTRATQQETVELSDVTNTNEVVTLPREVALTILEVVCEMRSAAVIGACLFQSLLKPTEAAHGNDVMAIADDLPTYITSLLFCFSQCLCNLDKLINSEQVVEVERQCTNLRCPMSTVRQWLPLLSMYGGRCRNCYLKHMDAQVRLATGKLRTSFEGIHAIFDKKTGALNLSLATRMIKGKHKLVTKAHNTLHDMLSKFASDATLLQIVPRLEEHDETCESVALALECLTKSAEATVIIEGVSIIDAGQKNPAMVSEAENFLKTKNVPGNSGIPIGFWSALKDVVNYTTEDTDAPPASTKKLIIPKAELDSAESSHRATQSQPSVGPAKRKAKKEPGHGSIAQEQMAPSNKFRKLAPKSKT